VDEIPEIRSIGDGKYSFLIGRQRYTLTTPLDEECFVRVVTTIQDIVKTLPPALTQDEKLFLALMSLSHKLEETQNKIVSLINKFSETHTDN